MLCLCKIKVYIFPFFDFLKNNNVQFLIWGPFTYPSGTDLKKSFLYAIFWKGNVRC